MDFFRGIGNWFRGAFGGDDDEEKKRRQQTQNQPKPPKPTQPEPTLKSPTQLFGNKQQSVEPTSTPTLFQTQNSGVAAPRSLRPEAQVNTQKQVEDAAQKLASGGSAAPYHPDIIKQAQPRAREIAVQKTQQQQIANPSVEHYNTLSPTHQRDYEANLKRYRDRISPTTTQGAAEIRRINEALGKLEEEGNRKNDVMTTGRGLFTGMVEAAQGGITNILGNSIQSITEPGAGQLKTNQDVERANEMYRNGEIDYDTLVRAFRKTPELFNVNNDWKVTRDGGIQRTEGVLDATGQFARQVGEAGVTAAEFLPIGFTSNLATRFGRFAVRGLQGGAFNALLSGMGSALNTASAEEADDIIQDAAVSFIFGGLIEGVTGGRPRNVDLTSAASVQREAISRAKELDPSLSDAEASKIVEEAANRLTNKGQSNRGNLKIDEQSPDADLESIITDESLPAFERKRAQDELNRRRQGRQEAELNDPGNEPTFMFNRRVQQGLNDLENRMNAEIGAMPDQSVEAVNAIRARYREMADRLVESMRQNRQTAEGMLDAQYEQQAAESLARANQVQNAADQRTEGITPAAGDSTPTAPTNPEVVANDGYRATIDNELYRDAPTFTERDNLVLRERFSPERWFRENVSRPLVEGTANRVAAAAQNSANPIARMFGRATTGFSREAGLTPAQLEARRLLRGGTGTGRLNRDTIGDLSKKMSPEQRAQVWATLDPELAARRGIEPGELSPEQVELQTKLKTLIDNTTAEMQRRGLITPEQAANESYIKRSYALYDGTPDKSMDKFEQGFRTELMKQTKGRKEVSDAMVQEAVTDPTYLVGKKTAEAEALFAMQDYGNFLVKDGVAVDGARPGYVQLPETAVFGDAAGKFVPQTFAEDFTGFQYQNAFVSALNDVFNVYDRWNVRQAKKALLTVFNPAVRTGNQVTNRLIFSGLGGINPASFNVKMAQVKDMIASNHQLYREAVQQGLTGVDATQAEFFARQMGNVTGDQNAIKRASAWLQNSYSAADDQAKIAAYAIYRERGYSAQEAANMTQRQFQDYKSVGFFYDLAAKTPIVGNAFVRFAGDAMRIAKNTAMDRPLTAAAMAMTWGALTNLMSIASDESEFKEGQNAVENTRDLFTGATKSDAQKTREDRFGAAKIPFTNISLTLQTPYGEINAARFMPWHMLNDIDSGLTGMLPIDSSPVTFDDGRLAVDAGGINDPLLAQFIQLGIDQDFRNKSIADPDNSENRDKYEQDPLSTRDQNMNRLRFLAGNNLPMGNELDALASSGAFGETIQNMTGGEDRFGKTRTIPQSIARLFGIKVEQYGDEQVANQIGRNAYFDDMEKINEELEGMTSGEQEAWKRLTGYYKLREQVENNFEPGTTRDKKAPVYDWGEDKWKDYASNPRLYELMVQKKQQDAARDGSPVQPEFDERLSASFRKQIIQNKMVAPGDDAELDQRMYTSPEWDYYQELKNRYSQAAGEYYGDNEYQGDELVRNQDAQFPTKPDAYKAYTDAYAAYSDGRAPAKPEFTDEVKAAREQYQKATFDWTNNARRARGLPPITWDVWNNPTFGFDTSPSGFGFGGSNYNPADHINTLGELTNFSNSVDGAVARKIQADEMANLAAIFNAVMAGGGGGRAKPKLGASSRGQG